MKFEDILAKVLGMEGGFVDDPRDSGGATKFGITEFVARQAGYRGPMAAMPIDVAKKVYRTEYWDKVYGDDLLRLSPELAAEVFDTAVNTGVGRASEFLQRFLNVNNQGGSWWPDLVVDGAMGPATMRALATFVAKRGERGVKVLAVALNCLQGAFYIDLAEKRGKDEAFVYGWLDHRVA